MAGHEVVVPPKTELSDRFLPLPRFAVRRLREIRNGRKGRIIGDLTPPQAARRYASWCKKESLPYVPVQNLRHSWATNALEAGVNNEKFKSIGGRQLSGRVPKLPVFHEPDADDFQSMRNVTIGPDL